MEITRILVACYKGDYWQTKACIASIRYWYPDFPVSLLKDELRGGFDTEYLQRIFNIDVFPLQRKKFGWGLSKLEPLFLPSSTERYLIIDSDILFVGPLLSKLNSSKADFIISPEYPDDPCTGWFINTYYNINKLQSIDNTFQYSGYTFNTGQFVASTGKIKTNLFEDLISYEEHNTPILLRNDIFACADQGRLNYILVKEESRGNITVDKIDFMIYCASYKVQELSLDMIKSKKGYPYLIHFAGRSKRALRNFDRKDIVCFFFMEYYKKLPFSRIRFLMLAINLEIKYGLLAKFVNMYRRFRAFY